MNRILKTETAIKIKRAIVIRIILVAFSVPIVLGIAVIALQNIAENIIWQPDNIIYIILVNIKYNLFESYIFSVLLVWCIMSIMIVKKLIYTIDDMLVISEKMISENDEYISFPEGMKEIENEMNIIKRKSLKNIRAAREAEQRKNDLIVYLAHDLKTPLTSIIGYLSLIDEESEIPDHLRKKYISIVLEKSERLEHLINEFFDITRFNLTSVEPEYETVNISRMLEQITYEFMPIMAEKSLSWNYEIGDDIKCLCDPDKMERVLDNLIRNAISYSYNGTVISCYAMKENNNVIISIENSGRTIPEEKLERIFEQFYRLDSSRSSKSGGAGLGLAIAKEIIEAHGGRLVAESKNEKIKLTITIPENLKIS